MNTQRKWMHGYSIIGWACVLLSAMMMLAGCADTFNLSATPVPDKTQPTPKPTDPRWSLYHSDPEHPWNQLFRQFYQRTVKGDHYGWDELEPLLWPDTTYLLDGPSHQQAIQLLDNFLTSNADELISDPLKRALLQRQMWAVFDWLAYQPDPYPAGRQALQARLGLVIRRLALAPQAILSLPDNYAAAVESKVFQTNYRDEEPDAAFLPSDLFHVDGGWVALGRADGPVAMSHTEEFPFFGRSVFLTFIRVPGGREATLNFIQVLNTEQFFSLPSGLDVALIRRAVLIDNQDNLVLSPLIETVQIRHFDSDQRFYAFSLSRAHLLEGMAGGLRPVTDEFLLFRGHGDEFETDHHRSARKGVLPGLCLGCHFNDGAGLQRSILSSSRMNFPLPDQQKPVLSATDWAHEAQTVIAWKLAHHSWQSLRAFWRNQSP